MNAAATPLPSPSRPLALANFAGFQLGWFAGVLAAAHGRPALGTAVIALLLAAHLCSVRRPWAEARLLAAALLTGLVCSSTHPRRCCCWPSAGAC